MMEARQALGFWSLSDGVPADSEMARKEKGGPAAVRPRCPGLRARFCLRLLSTMEEVLDARLSRVRGELNPLSTVTELESMLSSRAECADCWLGLGSSRLSLAPVKVRVRSNLL